MWGKKQQRQLFANDLQNRHSQKLYKIHRNASMSKYLFDINVGLHSATLLKKKLRHMCFSAVTIANLMGVLVLESFR